MRYNFDRLVDRNKTSSLKWDDTERLFGAKGLLPMWVADMDFLSPAPVIEALCQRAEHGIYGYTIRSDSYHESIINWIGKRHGWQIEKEWLTHSPGIVSALSFIVQTYTKPGDKVVIQPPIYYPFLNVVKNNGRELVFNPLILNNGRYEMDFDDLRGKLAGGDVKIMLLCSPHNPVGRVWSREELTELGQICLEHNVLVISDEIHFDIVMPNQSHTNFAEISKAFADNSITCTAPSKTFNLAGLQASTVIIPNPLLREQYMETINRHSLKSTNTFGVTALESAYRNGEEWLDQLLVYLSGNLDYLLESFADSIPLIKPIKPEGTYMVWLDCRELGMDDQQLEHFFVHDANVALRQGYMFGPGGTGFMRINIACPRDVLHEGIKRIEQAVNRLPINQ